MLNQSLRAATALSGWRILRSVVTFFIVSAMIILGTQIVVGHPAKAQGEAASKPQSSGVTPQGQTPEAIYVSDIKLLNKNVGSPTTPLTIRESTGQVVVNWTNKHPEHPEDQPTTNRSFKITLPRNFWFYRPAMDGKREGFFIQKEVSIGGAEPRKENLVRCDYPAPVADPASSTGVTAETGRTVICAYTEKALDLWNDGQKDISGDFQADVQVVAPTEGEVPGLGFNVNGANVEVPIPGKRINIEKAPGPIGHYSKVSVVAAEGKADQGWYFRFSGKVLQDAFAKANPTISQQVNGKDRFTIVIEDTATGDLSFADNSALSLGVNKFLKPCTPEELEANKRGIECGTKLVRVDDAVIKLTTGNTYEPTSKDGGKVTAGGDQKVSIEVTAAFDPNASYTLTGLQTQVYGKVQTNKRYANHSRVLYKGPDGLTTNTGLESAATAEVPNTQSGNIVWQPGTGSFTVRKIVGGEFSRKYEPGSKVLVEYTYRLPENGTFAKWGYLENLRASSKSLVDSSRAPEPSENGGVATMEIEIGKSAKPASLLPTQTAITFREIVDPANASFSDPSDGVEYFWGTPKYSVGDKPNVQEFKIEEKKDTQAQVENFQIPSYPLYVVKKWESFPEGVNKPENINFTYTCVGEGQDGAEKQFTYNVGGDEKQIVGRFPAGVKCEFTEKPEGLAFDGFTPSLQWEPAAENDALKGVAIADKDNEGKRTATVTNSYVRNVGTFKVKKTVQGVVGEAGNGKSFKFTYTCSDGQSGEVGVVGNGEAVAVDKQFPIGTTCDVQESDDIAPIEHHDLVKPAPQQVQIAADEQTLTFVNAYKSRGTFEVAKRVEGVEEAALQGKTYSFDYVCGPEKGRIENVIPGGPAVPAPATFPTGTTCTVTESLEAAKIEGYTVAPHKPVEVTIGAPGAPLAKAEFVNKYTRDLGSFKIRKSVKGDGNFTNDSFDVQYRCGTAEPVTLNLKGNEEWTVVENLPTGTECEISEDQATAKRAGFTEAIKIDNPTVTIDKAKVAEVTVTNTYAQNKGGFTISKSLAGNGQNRAKDKEFTFSYKCTDPQGDVVKEEKQLKVKAGEVKSITDVPELATCVVEELDGDVQNADLKTTVKVELEGGEVGTPEAEKPASPAAPANNGAPAAEANENAVAPAENAPANNAAAPQPVVAVPVADPLEEAGEAANEDPAEGEAPQPAPAQPAVPAAPADNAPAANAPAGEAPAVVAPEKPEKQDTPVVVDEGMADGNKATFTIGKDTTHKVLVVNEYTDHVGGLSVIKIVEGDSVEMIKDQPFIFDIKCEDGQSKVLEVLGNGTPVDSGLRIPVGTKCEVSEQADKAQRAAFDLKAPEKQEVTITKRDEVVATTFKNEYIKHVGTFSVAKNVKGLPAEEAKNKEFLFNYSCFDGQKGEIKVKGDGVAVDAGVKIPVGTDCTVTENAASAKVKGFTVKLPENQNIRFEKKDQKSELSFTNEYKPEPSAPVPGNPDPKGGMDPKDPPKNTPPNPGILGFLPFIPFLFGNAGSSGTPNGTNAETVAGTNNTTNGTNGGANNATNTANPAGQKSLLANTGASVIGIGLLALVVTSVGIFLAVRGRKNKS